MEWDLGPGGAHAEHSTRLEVWSIKIFSTQVPAEPLLVVAHEERDGRCYRGAAGGESAPGRSAQTGLALHGGARRAQLRRRERLCAAGDSGTASG
eukprot:8783065-Pyramimonas_sp.AAC.1